MMEKTEIMTITPADEASLYGRACRFRHRNRQAQQGRWRERAGIITGITRSERHGVRLMVDEGENTRFVRLANVVEIGEAQELLRGVSGWQVAYDGKRWRDMPATDRDLQKLQFALYRRGEWEPQTMVEWRIRRRQEQERVARRMERAMGVSQAPTSSPPASPRSA
jgi:hypothetical protein